MHPVARAARKKARGFGIVIHKAIVEFRTDFVGALADRRADDGVDAPPLGAEVAHRVNRRLEHTRMCPFPTGMCRADHAGFGIGKKDRHAIRRQNGQRHTRCRSNQRIGLGARVVRPGECFDCRRMDLVHTDKVVRCHRHGVCNALAVDGHDLGLVRAARAAIESLKDPR